MKVENFSVVLALVAGLAAWGDAAHEMILDPSRPMGIVRYGVDDYVTNGLVAHFDGELNAGRGVAHDPAATTWVNLTEGSPDAVFRRNIASTADASADGTWERQGYRFNGTSYAVLASAAELFTTNFTVQLACDVDPDAQPYPEGGGDYYPNYLSNNHDFGFFSSSYARFSVFWKADAYQYAMADNSSRPRITSWQGKYITAGMDEGSVFITQA